MEHYTVQQRIEIIHMYHQNSLSVRAAFRVLREIYGQHYRSTEGTIRRIVGKFETIMDQLIPVRHRNNSSDENTVAVRESANKDPNFSIPRRAQELGLFQTSTWRILRKGLSLFPYKS